MTIWRLEWLRLVRTRRWLALAAPFLLFGLTGPLIAKNLALLLGDNPIVELMPPPTAADGFDTYVRNVSQIGVLVLAVAAAAALAFDSTESAGAFLRRRVRTVREIVVPKVIVNATAAVVAFVVGSAAAWYETVVLIGPLPAGRVLLGTALVCVYLVFVVCVVALASGLTRGVVATVLIALAVLLVMPLLGIVGALAPWLPSELMGAPTKILRGGDAWDFARPAAVALAVAAACVPVAVRLLARREL